ncbi:WbqC family protein, partial [Vibrio harveyi]|nr:WbqC family protein [Vibrio harveyi]
SCYCEYTQVHEGFDHFVTILDVIFNCGPNSMKYIVGRCK